jgi:general secretion pathway protein M
MIGRAWLRAPALGRWWAQRSPRERVLLAVMAAALGSYGIIAGVAQPLLAARSAALAGIARSDAALARLAVLPTASPGADERPAAAILTETAPGYGLSIRRIEAEGDGARLDLGDAGFAEIVLWIDELERAHALRLVAVEMERRPTPGVVGARLTFGR